MSSHGCSFTEFADKYSQITLRNTKYLGFRDVPALLQRYVKGNKALDFGCGQGKSTTFLRKLGFAVDGVDINEHMIDLAQKALPENDFKLIKDGKIPAKNEQYDLVFASWVFHDVGPKNKLCAAFLEIARVLKKGGTFVAVVCSEDFYTRDWSDVTAKFEENKNLKSGDIAKVLFKENNFIIRSFIWGENDYRDALRQAGLDVVLIHEPLGRDDEGFAWINETEIAPYPIYVARKPKIGSKFEY